jgi:3-hydroxyacyl-[acyl-carrier-protein] dehydratase
METDWSIFQQTWAEPDGSRYGKGTVGPSTPWFEGHFPDWPVLPGVSLLYGLLVALEADLGSGPLELKNVRFRQVVVPGKSLDFRCSAPSGRGREFRVEVEGRMACSGLLAPIPGEESG